jgi:cobalt-precorrin 5A hydrolase
MERHAVKVAGIGFRGAADLASLQDALQKALTEAGFSGLDAIVTEAAKSREKVFRELAQVMGLPGLGVTQSDLAQMITPTQSQRIVDQFGTGSLAEAAALAAAGPDARLVARRVVSGDGMATAAIAHSQEQGA